MDKKRKKVDRKFRMTPKMTVKVTPKMTPKRQRMILMGTEPREVMEFGNVYTPLIDLISTRYEEQLYTIFTTNLTPAQLEEKYGKRIVDRLNEMVEKVVFENESYRR